ncbi:MAG: response regulator [candidate division KSB1 bacterium]|nr:response regulator [candidate division KSB1 bacterium]MDZ7301685.1 response regulator [candidate division KSB1 bacterium]MDZ7312428.1 response regulator [candidate division KSB1 bacterium]
MHPSRQRTRENSFVILLATCDQQISEELSRALKHKKVELLTFDNARDMLLAIAERQIHLIIFDSSISELKGLGILSVIKKFRPNARVIAMEENLSFEKQAAMAQEGVIYQIQKPMNPSEISQVVETVVDKLSRHG